MQRHASSPSLGNGKYSASSELVIYRNPRHVLPPKFQNILRNIISASTASGVNIAQAWTNVDVSSTVAQFNSTQPISTVVGSNGLAAFLRNGTTVAQSSDGAATMALLYGYYRVLHIRLIIRVIPLSTADALIVSVAADNVVNTQNSTLTPNTASAQPFYQNMVFQQGMNNRGGRPNQLVLDTPIHTILGLSKTQYYDLVPTAVNVSPATALSAIANINFFPVIGAVTTLAVAYEFELEQLVEWSAPADIS
jgi:hypothetical protein